MLERVTMRALPVVNRGAEYAPVLPACCNVCRTCTTTNLLGLVSGLGVAAVTAVSRFFTRP